MASFTTATPQQVTFANEYLKTGNATQSYMVAYPAARKWKIESVRSQALRTLRVPTVSRIVKSNRREYSEATTWTIARVIISLAETAQEARAAGKHGPAVRAYELIGKHLDMFGRDAGEERPNVTLNVIQSLDQATLRTLASRYDAIEAEIAGPSATSRMAEIAGLPAPTPSAELSISHSAAIPDLDTYDDSST